MFRSTSRFSFVLKAIVTLLLVVAFDRLFLEGGGVGWTLGAFAFAWTVGLTIARPATRRDVACRVALGAALLFALTLMDNPSLLGWTMFWAALAIAALLPRTIGFDDAYRWAARLFLHALSGPAGGVVDAAALLRKRRRAGRFDARAAAALLALPIAGTILFVALFASANPVIEQLLEAIRLPPIWRVWAWILAALAVWPAFRPRAFVTRAVALLPDPELRLPGASLPSVILALALFNAVFAIQNALDLVFLWSGAPLPAGMTMAEYVHRGAYPLIATALIAGFLVLAMLRPGSAPAASPLARRLVMLWVAQNLVLVASSALRTIDYIAESMLTAWRIAALIWMALVALGLVLICWRILAGRSARWLINANALAAAVALTTCTVIDISASAAAWNVRHAREAGGGSAPLDLCYLAGAGPSALVSLAELERRPLPADFRDRLQWVRERALENVQSAQADWHSWTWRGARRLATARVLLGDQPPKARPVGASEFRDCDGAVHDRPDA